MLPLIVDMQIPGLGPLEVPSYFLMVTVAFLVGTSLAVRDARRMGIRVIDVLDLSLIALAFGLAGARLAHVFLESPWITLPVPAQSNAGWTHFFCRMAGENHDVTRPWNLGRYYLLHPQMVFALWNGGLVFYGGLILGLPAGWIFCRRRNLAFWPTADLVAPIAAAGLSFGRMGCLLAGCCHGKPIEGAFKSIGIVIESSGFRDAPLWPTQPFETLACFVICWILYRMQRVKAFDGQIFLALLLLYGVWRAFDESLRGDEQRGLHGGLTTSQWISVALVSAALALAPILWKRRVRPMGGGTAPRAPSSALAGA
ncbi:MAG TPA: prolipoprotein diacylglyceryl transferase [bacterium]|nr:prolipoprotein diacylglyceryl transferase [bacterium]